MNIAPAVAVRNIRTAAGVRIRLRVKRNMGFGTLFIGYFLILNLTYYGATDLIAGIVMMMAFYKLRTVNKYFSFAILPSALFALVGVPELIELGAKMFGGDLSFILNYTAAPRYLVICMISILMMKGIEKVAREVEVYKTAKSARNVQPLIYLVFVGMMILELPITYGEESKWIALAGLIFLLGVIVDVWLVSPYLQDAESGKTFSFAATKKNVQKFHLLAEEEKEKLCVFCRKNKVDLIDMKCNEDPVKPFMEFFRRRERHKQ